MTSQVVGGQVISEWKWMFFQLLSGIKVKFVDEMMQNNYLFVIEHVKRKKLLTLIVFTWFLILERIQDGDHVWWRHRLPAAPPRIKYTSSCREDQRLSSFPLKAKSFRNTGTYQKLKVEVPLTPPPPTLYHGRSMTLRVRPRVNKLTYKKSFDFLETRRIMWRFLTDDSKRQTHIPRFGGRLR